MTLKAREKILLYVTIGVISLFVMERVFFYQFRKKLKNLYQQIKVSEANLRTGLEVQKRKETILAEYQKYQTYLTTPNVSDGDRVASFLKEVERIAQESGVSIINLNPKNEPLQLVDYKQYTVDLRIEGDVEAVVDFLYQIQKSPLLIQLENLSISAKGEDAALLRVETTVNLSVP